MRLGLTMRIVIVAEVYLPKIDGVVIRTLNLIRQLQKNGDEVLVICAESDRPIDSPVPCAQFRGFSFPMYPEYRIGIPDKSLADTVREFQPDVVHFLNPFAFGFRCYDIMERCRLNVPTVFSFHTLYGEFVKRYGPPLRSFSRLLWWLTQRYHNNASLNLTVSSITRQQLQSRGFERVRLWQPAVDSSLFSPDKQCAAMRARLMGNHEQKKLLLTVSRLAPEKNVEFLAGLLKRTPNAALAVVGDGPHRRSLEKTFSGLPTSFIGYLQGEELAAAYASADAFVYASETETMGNVVLEAMSCGTPVIAPRAGGIPMLVDHEESGLLFEPGDLNDAAARLQSVLDHPETAARLTTSARAFAMCHGWNDAAMQVRADYEAAIAEFNGDQKQKMPRTRVLPRATTRALVMGFRAASAVASRRPKQKLTT